MHAQEARTALVAQSGLVDAYGGDKDPADLTDATAARKELLKAVEALQATPGIDATEREQAAGLLAAQAKLDDILDAPGRARCRHRATSTTGSSRTPRRSSAARRAPTR